MLTLVILNWKRPKNVTRIVETQRHYRAIERIIVWNNNPDMPFESEHAEVLNCDSDMGLFSRFTAAAMADTDAVMIQDDDLLVPKATVDELYEQWRREPGVIHGTFGRNIEGKVYRAKNEFGRTDIVLTRCLVVHRDHCLAVLEKRHLFADLPGVPVGNGEDIILSAVAFNKSGRGNRTYRLPTTELPQPHAISKWRGHLNHRTQIVRRCIEVLSR